MKRVGGLFDQIWTRDNLSKAVWNAARGKRHRREVIHFFKDLEANLAEMSHQIRRGTYPFQSYKTFSIRDPKRREIHAPAFRDRVMHHALIAVTAPVFERGALATSFACRKGKGQHEALKKARDYTHRYAYYGKVDIKSYYDSIDHQRLEVRLRRRFREERLLDLWSQLLSSYEGKGAPRTGLPIGALTSQYLGNFFLDELDHFIASSGLIGGYVRYMDDVLMFGEREGLNQLREWIYAKLGAMGLQAKHGGEWNASKRGVPYLGFVLYPNRVRVNRMGRKRLRRKFRELEGEERAGRCAEREYQERATALFAHPKWGDDLEWRRHLIEGISSSFREVPERASGFARRLVEPYGEELPFRVSEQESSFESQQEQRLPRGAAPWHGDPWSPDVAPSGSPALFGGDESRQKSSLPGDIQKSEHAPEDRRRIRAAKQPSGTDKKGDAT